MSSIVIDLFELHSMIHAEMFDQKTHTENSLLNLNCYNYITSEFEFNTVALTLTANALALSFDEQL